MKFRPLAAALLTCAVVHASLGPALGQGAGTRQGQLLRMAEVLGGLHSIRGRCSPGEAQTWRDYMLEMLRHEDPHKEERAALVETFNTAYHAQGARFPGCSPQAMREADRLSRQGAGLAQSMSAGLAF
jgi:uncharacterized protein (TIGR02301 family)